LSIPIYLTVSPGEAVPPGPYRTARAGFRLSPEVPALLAPEPGGGGPSLMVLEGSGAPPYEASPALAEMLARYALGFHEGLLCAWETPEEPFYRALAALLGGACAGAGVPLYVPEESADDAPDAAVLIRAGRVSGPFARAMAEAAARYPERCVLALASRCFRLVPPCDEAGEPVSEEARRALRERAGTPSFLSSELCRRYFAAPREEGVEFIVYDSRDGAAAQIAAAEAAGFRAVVGRLSALAALPEE